MAAPSKGKLLYDITRIENIPSIVNNGLLSRKELMERGLIDFEDIADHQILEKRDQYSDILSSCVPFHFFVKNPFDGRVCKRYGSENMAIIAIRRELYKTKELYIIPSHPLDREHPEVLSYGDGIKRIRWDILDNITDRDYHDEVVRKNCMAECLSPSPIDVSDFFAIYVKNETAKNKLVEMLVKQCDFKLLDFLARHVRIDVAERMFP